MDFVVSQINTVMDVVPVPFLSNCWSVATVLIQAYKDFKASQKSVEQLTYRVSIVITTLNAKCSKLEYPPPEVKSNLGEFQKLLIEICNYFDKLKVKKKLYFFLNSKDVAEKIEEFDKNLSDMINLMTLTVANWNNSDLHDAAQFDQRELTEFFKKAFDAQNGNIDLILSNLEVGNTKIVDNMSDIQKNMFRFEDSVQGQLSFIIDNLAVRSKRSLKTTKKEYYVDADSVDIEENVIAVGSFGEVLKARWNNRVVAVKRSIQVLHSEAIIKEIEGEADKWWPLKDCPSILPLFGVCINTDKPFLIMPFMQNGSVFNYLFANPKTSLKQRVSWICDIAFGMEYLAGRGMSDNVLLDVNLHAYVCDFGLAKFNSSTGSKGKRTSAVRFVAPELFKRKGPSRSELTDVFAFGMTAYQILVGRVAYFKEIIDEELVKEWIAQGIDPERVGDTIPDELWFMLRPCWSNDPKVRPRFSAIAASLSRYLKSSPGTIGAQPEAESKNRARLEELERIAKLEKEIAEHRRMMSDSTATQSGQHSMPQLQQLSLGSNGVASSDTFSNPPVSEPVRTQSLPVQAQTHYPETSNQWNHYTPMDSSHTSGAPYAAQQNYMAAQQFNYSGPPVAATPYSAAYSNTHYNQPAIPITSPQPNYVAPGQYYGQQFGTAPDYSGQQFGTAPTQFHTPLYNQPQQHYVAPVQQFGNVLPVVAADLSSKPPTMNQSIGDRKAYLAGIKAAIAQAQAQGK